MPKRQGAGRRSRRGTPMPNATITASADEMAFLLLIGEGTLATGVQRLVAHAAKKCVEMVCRQIVAGINRAPTGQNLERFPAWISKR
jgi:hypothetical protein